jgi:hypothetical protein
MKYVMMVKIVVRCVILSAQRHENICEAPTKLNLNFYIFMNIKNHKRARFLLLARIGVFLQSMLFLNQRHKLTWKKNIKMRTNKNDSTHHDEKLSRN